MSHLHATANNMLPKAPQDSYTGSKATTVYHPALQQTHQIIKCTD